jgi:hypothetical protein
MCKQRAILFRPSTVREKAQMQGASRSTPTSNDDSTWSVYKPTVLGEVTSIGRLGASFGKIDARRDAVHPCTHHLSVRNGNLIA